MCKRWSAAALVFVFAGLAWADGPADNLPNHVRPIPRRGIELSAKDKAELEQHVDALGQAIASLRTKLAHRPALLALLPDVQIYYNAVRYAVTYHELLRPQEIGIAHRLLQQGQDRAQSLHEGKAPWTTATGLIVRGYVSRIDGSVQPYGLVIPVSYRPGAPYRHRLDAWFHGRNEDLTELNFINEREHQPGEFTPRDTFVLHPYGRFCNANRFAGEVDLFEALADVQKHYPIDPNRISVRGFSMGGAACWTYATHHAGEWAAAAPGAGFSETADFLKVFQNEKLRPTWWEQKLWHLYDSTDYAINLYNCPTVAYSGAIDRQKQAADMMAMALKAEGITLTHILGPHTAHQYEPRAKQEVSRRIEAIMARGRNPVPHRIHFTTWTLRYNKMLWLTVDGLRQHWERARVDAALTASGVHARTHNVTALTFSFGPGACPLEETVPARVVLDGQSVAAAPVLSDRSWVAHFRKDGDQWQSVPSSDDGPLRKRHRLQGPIDDAFMDSFLMVRPTGSPQHSKTSAWVQAEMHHALREWRHQFRGEARVKDDRDVADSDIAACNLVLWGDPQSNKVLARIADRLPVHWDKTTVGFGQRPHSASDHVAILIYPNPLNPKCYVVLNSGFTYREYDYLNNARQTPKLPDFAVVDVNVPPSSRWPGKIVDAGFFDERWQIPESRP